MILPEILSAAVERHPYPILFATVSGAHLYGFPSPDSDYDLRGVHILPLRNLVGLQSRDETYELSCVEDGIELDLVTHHARKFFLLMLKKNGYVLEQLYSPLIVYAREEHEELKEIGKQCITRHHAHHYLGFAASQWKLFLKERERRVKPLLYVYRVLLTGIHLMRTGEIEANLVTLNRSFSLPYIDDLVGHKLAAGERQILDNVDVHFHEGEFKRLIALLEHESKQSSLPEAPTAKPALNDLLERLYT
ncbi:MAG: nucleotidyltransferase domain-containing protein [Terriglobales bacterium]